MLQLQRIAFFIQYKIKLYDKNITRRGVLKWDFF